MAKIKETLEGKLMLHKRIGKLFPEGASLDRRRSRHFKLSIKLLESDDEVYDNHEVIISVKSNEELSFLVNGRAIVAAMRDLKDDCPACAQEINIPHVAFVIDDEPVFSSNNKQMDIRFQVINNITRKK